MARRRFRTSRATPTQGEDALEESDTVGATSGDTQVGLLDESIGNAASAEESTVGLCRSDAVAEKGESVALCQSDTSTRRHDVYNTSLTTLDVEPLLRPGASLKNGREERGVKRKIR